VLAALLAQISSICHLKRKYGQIPFFILLKTSFRGKTISVVVDFTLEIISLEVASVVFISAKEIPLS